MNQIAKIEWPLGKQPAGAAEHAPPPLPLFDETAGVLRFTELVAEARSSEAVEAFARHRAGHILHSGHSPQSDLQKGLGELAAEAQYRLAAFHEIVGRYRMNLPPNRRGDCLKYIASAGAVLIALFERCQIEVDEDAGDAVSAGQRQSRHVPGGQPQTRRG